MPLCGTGETLVPRLQEFQTTYGPSCSSALETQSAVGINAVNSACFNHARSPRPIDSYVHAGL
jgi:hypothetical protein